MFCTELFKQLLPQNLEPTTCKSQEGFLKKASGQTVPPKNFKIPNNWIIQFELFFQFESFKVWINLWIKAIAIRTEEQR